ncbi:MAG TPA: exosortase/archaeosortase family protein [Flavipsychrobacter sp.]|nr:exosortase/archaeosortase family protein [Flavipsychrobacter sp.]
MSISRVFRHQYFPIALFLFLYVFFYFGNKAYTGLTVPGNAYSPFLDEHLNYVKSFRRFLLEGAAFVIRLFDHQTFIYEHGLKMETGRGVKLIYACMGFAIFSFWWAMILAFPQSVKNKILYLVGGTAIIIFLNILRIAFVALAYNRWGHSSIDHHLIFNIVVYGILFLMLYRWFNIKPKEE